MRFNGRCRCGEVANVESLTHPDPLYRLIFLRLGEIGLLCALNDYDFYRLY